MRRTLSSRRVQPIFVGGTGRSGTTVTALMLGAHPACHAIPVEVRFLTDPGGLCDLAAGRVPFRRFRARLRGRWTYRVLPNGVPRGLYEVLDEATIERALPALRDGIRHDPWLAAGEFARRLLDPLAAAAGADCWVEMTPGNARRAPDLLRLFPDMRLIHSIRDGRDVACSVVPLPWGPSNAEEGLEWWAESLQQAFEACDLLPADRLLDVRLEDLVVGDRETQYARVRAFAGLDDHPALREYFEHNVTDRRAHVGRWMNDIAPDRVAQFEARYQVLVSRLGERGHTL